MAHRLGTVADCDFVIELSNGQVISSDPIENLKLAS
jgi:ABC-type transport system involved in Fe-S cluster assembly fused permease/ATPase subunit